MVYRVMERQGGERFETLSRLKHAIRVFVKEKRALIPRKAMLSIDEGELVNFAAGRLGVSQPVASGYVRTLRPFTQKVVGTRSR